MCLPTAGGLSAMSPMDLVRQIVDALLQRAGVHASDIDRLLVECDTETGGQPYVAGQPRQPGDPVQVHIPAITIGQRCGTGQQILHLAAQEVAQGRYGSVVVAGAGSMYGSSPTGDHSETSATPAPFDKSAGVHPRVLAAELLAAKWGIRREHLDAYTVRSHQRASEVAAAGEFEPEIVPITVASDGLLRQVLHDEAIDIDLTTARLRTLGPTVLDPVVARQHPEISCSITVGNSARRVAGASALLLMNEHHAARLGVRPRAYFCGFSVARPDPALPLAAPLQATKQILADRQMSVGQLDHVEVDEEFACVPLAWTAEFPVSPDLFNPRGGALALGIPRACGGLRQITTMLNALEATGGRFGLQTMSADAGGAYACLIECR